MKIISVSVKAIDNKGHVRILSLADVDISIKEAAPNPIAKIPQIIEETKPAKKESKKKDKK